MRNLVLLVLFYFPITAYGYDVSAVMPPTTGATSCQLYLDGVAVGTVKPCGSMQSYPGLISNPGVYVFAYRAVNSTGQSALSPTRTVSIDFTPPPVDPTDPPDVVVVCNPSPCPTGITITVQL